MLCEKAINLIKELQRAEGNLTPYDTDGVNEVNSEIFSLIEDIQKNAQHLNDESIATNNQPYFGTFRMQNAAVKRNTRCLIAYHYHRLRSLRTLRWEFGSILPPDIKSNMSASESEWFSKYSRNLAKYMRSIGNEGINLAINLKPPKSLYIEVKCLIDYGRLELNDGTILLLKKDSRHYLPRNECEELIRQGIFQHIV